MKNLIPKNTEYNSTFFKENSSIPLTKPEISGNEWKYIKECLDTSWVSSAGKFVDRFEQEMSKYIGTKYAVATVNGTSALHVALIVAGIKPEDEVITSDMTFIAPANAIRYVGAFPVFIDAEPNYWQLDPEKIHNFLKHECNFKYGYLINKNTKRNIKAIMPVHILGHPVDLDPILDIAKRYELKVIEDASESLGAKYKDQMVGSLGDISCLSFNGNKIITTGGGGMIVTNNKKWAEKAKYLTTQAKDDPFEYIHNEIGYNYRLTNLQAAMGCAQLENIESFVKKKRLIAKIYKEAFKKSEKIDFMREAEWAYSTYWMPTILINKFNSRLILQKLISKNIISRTLWQPMHLSKAHNYYNVTNNFPVSERLYKSCLSLPSFIGLSDDEQELVINELLKEFNS